MVASIIIPVVVVLGLAVVAAAVVFLAMRLRSGEPFAISFRVVLTAYFYLLSIAGLIVLLVGLSGLVNAGLSTVAGRDFSYNRPPSGIPRPVPAVPPGIAAPQAPSPEEQKLEADRQQEREFREGLLQGISMSLVGGLVWLTHSLGRRRTEGALERQRGFLNTGYLVVLLVIFSLVGIISLASGVFETLRFYLVEPATQFEFRPPPGPNASAAIVFVPAWAYYLIALLRNFRERQRA